MDLQPGEHVCSECRGTGTCPPADEKIKFDELRATCGKCGGSGKVDWVTNAMGESKHPFFYNTTKIFETSPDSDLTFYINGKTMLEIKKDGFYVQGQKVTDKKKIYDRFHKFLKTAGF